MPSYTFSIGGSSRTVQAEGFSITETANGQNTLTCDVVSSTGSYRPAQDDEITVTEGATLIFGGLVQTVDEGWTVPAGSSASIRQRVQAKSFDVYATWRIVNETIPAGTLEDALNVLVTYLTVYGVAMDAGQVTGPSLTELTFTNRRLDDCLNDLSTLTGYVWAIDASKQLSMFLPGSTAAPFDVADGDGHVRGGDVEVDRTRNDDYATKVYVNVTGAGPATSTELFTAADGVTAGAYIYFTTKYPSSQSQDDAWPNEFILNGVNLGPVGFIGIAETGAWDWDSANHRLRYTIASGATYPAGADEITVTYAIGYPFTVYADSGLTPLRERFIDVGEAMSVEAAQAYADAIINKLTASKITVTYPTLETGIHPGMSQHITIANRNLNDDVVVSEVTTERLNATTVKRTVSAQVSDQFLGTYRDTLARILGDKVGRGGVSTTGVAQGGDPDALYDAGNSGSAKTIDWGNGKAQFLTLTGNCTLTFSNPIDGGRYVLILKQDGTGGRTVTYPASVKWDNGNTPWMSSLAAAGVLTTYMYVSSLTKYIGAWNSPYAL